MRCLFILLLLGFVGCALFYPSEKNVRQKLKEANYCKEDNDCAFLGPNCPFGCEAPINKSQKGNMQKLIADYRKGQWGNCSYTCGEKSDGLECIKNKCERKWNDQVETPKVFSYKEIKCDHPNFLKLPFIAKRCQGEGCADIFPTFIGGDLTLRKEPSQRSEIVGVLKKCERLGDFSSREVITALGRARIVSPSGEYKGVKLLHNQDVVVVSKSFEGYYTVCVRDELIGAAKPKTNEPVSPMSYLEAEILEPISSSSWIKITTLRGEVGFAPLVDKAIIWGPFDKRVKECGVSD